MARWRVRWIDAGSGPFQSAVGTVIERAPNRRPSNEGSAATVRLKLDTEDEAADD